MSDPYAAGLGLDDNGAKLGVAPARVRTVGSAADWQAASAAQRFDSTSSAIAAQEVAQAKTPSDRAAALKTQSYTNAKIAQQGGADPAQPANDPYAAGLGLDSSGAPLPTSVPGNGMPPMPAAVHFPTSSIWHPSTWGVSDFEKNMKPGSDAYADALYAKTGSSYYKRPGESDDEAQQRSQMYDQVMRNAGVRQPADPIKLVASAGSNLVGSIAGGMHGLWSRATGGDAKTAAANVEKAAQGLTYVPSDPETRAQVGMMNSGANPVNWPAIAGDAAGGKLGEMGAPGAGATVATVSAALPMLLGLKPTRSAVSAAARGAGTSLMDLMKPPAPPMPKVEPTLDGVPAGTTPSTTVPAQPADLSLTPQQPVPGKSQPFMAGAPATETPAAPNKPNALPNQARAPAGSATPTFSDPANNVFAESAPDAQGGVSTADQARRAAVLNEIGLDQVRRSAVTGDASQAAVDFQTSRLKGSPAGDAMSQQLNAEKQAISDYADSIARKTGGSSLNDQSAKLARGEAILTPLEGLKEWFDNQTSELYKTADERAQGVPTQLDNFRSVLGDDSLATNSDRVNLRTAAGAYAKKLGIVDEQGNVFANAQQAETMRKYLNENWSPQNSGLVGKLKDALDSDVMSAAGEDVYGQARALRAQRAQTLDNPNGIAKLLDSSGPQGVNRSVPVEKVADALTNMPVAQLGNIVKTLKNMPPELQPMAADALAEIKAQYAHNVKDIGANQAGQWNAKGVQKYLSNNSARMGMVFSPEEMKTFGTLNDAGNILAKDQSYPGAFAQQQNLLRAGVSHAISSGSTAAGAAVAGPIGAAVGNVLGGKMAGKFNDASTLRATQKRMVSLRDMAGGAP